MRNFRIFAKLFLSHSLVGLLVISALSFIFYTLLSKTLIERSLDQLASINILKSDLVESYFFRSLQNLEALQVEDKFLRIYHDLISRTASEPSQHDLVDIENLRRLYNFKNIHVFNTHHHQLFSTEAEMYPEGLLSKIDSAIVQDPQRMRIIDASSYSQEKHTLLFYYVPILEQDSLLGIVLVQENFQKIEGILLETTGMGNTGESYLVGEDYALRSSSRFFPEIPPGAIRVETEAVRNSFQELPGRGILDDYRGISVLSVYRMIKNEDLKWAIVTEIDEGEAMQPILELRNYFVVITLLSIVLTLAITYFLSNRIVQPILKLKKVIASLARGVIPKQNLPETSSDEIGEIGRAIHQLVQGLQRTTLFANEIGSGNLEATFTTLSDRDELGSALLRMRDELSIFHEKELRSARARAAALLEGQESERRRIIKELHDGVGQMLTAIRMQVDMLESEPVWKEQIKSQINETIDEVKRISYNVMPQSIVDFGLEAALRGLCDTIRKYSPAVIDFRYVRETEHTLDFEISIAVFRIAQEGLNNMVKHANASVVNLYVLDKADEVYLVLEDDGQGFQTEGVSQRPGSGLRNIAERATLLNGTAEVYSSPGGGTTIEVHIPIN
jgi:signal transduction histidine kinase